MKKQTIITLTGITFLVIASLVAITSCTKNEKTTPVANGSSANHQSAKILSGPDSTLWYFDANFVNNRDGSQTITFAEPEDIDVMPDLASNMGFTSLSFAAGYYTINVDVNGHSTLVMPIASYSGSGMTSPSVMGIYIARRWKDKCGTDPVTHGCLCGIGFRCGMSFEEQTPYEQVASVSVKRDTNGNPTHLIISFRNNNIDWPAIEG